MRLSLCIMALVVSFSFFNASCAERKISYSCSNESSTSLDACPAGSANALEKKADLVVYSFNRPLQLYALLESAQQYMIGVGDIHVIYRATEESYAQAYDLVKKDFDHVSFLQQGDNPHQDFKPLTLQAAFSSAHEHIIFAVDDIIVKDFIDVTSDITLLEETHAYGFYYRLGKNLSYCYTMQRDQAVPPLQEVAEGIYSWKFCQAEHDWGYPNTVDMTLYKKEDIKNFFETVAYEAPNPLEGKWSCYAHQVCNRLGLCYEQSKIVNLPLNRVQTFYNNGHMGVDPQYLLNEFNEGKKIDINPLFRIANKSAHEEYALTFVLR